MSLATSVAVGQLREWWPEVVMEDQRTGVFVVVGLELDTIPQLVHTLESGSHFKRRMGDILAWSDPL